MLSVYEKAVDPKLKASKLDQKAKALIEIIRINPYQTPPSYEKLQGNLHLCSITLDHH